MELVGKDKLEKEALIAKKVFPLDNIKNSNNNKLDKVDGGGGANLASFALTELVKEFNSEGADSCTGDEKKEQNTSTKKKWLLQLLKFAKIFILITLILFIIKASLFPGSSSSGNISEGTAKGTSEIEFTFDKLEKILSLILNAQQNQNDAGKFFITARGATPNPSDKTKQQLTEGQFPTENVQILNM